MQSHAVYQAMQEVADRWITPQRGFDDWRDHFLQNGTFTADEIGLALAEVEEALSLT
jgi:hypothetical protein